MGTEEWLRYIESRVIMQRNNIKGYADSKTPDEIPTDAKDDAAPTNNDL